MRRFRILALSTILFALTAGPATSNTGAGQSDRATWSSAQENGIQLAQRGRCRAFGKTNSCRPLWDRRSKSCVCAGA